MKKLLFLLFIIPVFTFAQTSPTTPQFVTPTSGNKDSLGYKLPIAGSPIKWFLNSNYLRSIAVPYTGATADLNLGSHLLRVNTIYPSTGQETTVAQDLGANAAIYWGGLSGDATPGGAWSSNYNNIVVAQNTSPYRLGHIRMDTLMAHYPSAWSSITGKPTTLSGYGITDAINTSTLTETVQFTKGYITYATPNNVRNSEGDVLMLTSGKYLSVYGRYNRTLSDLDPTTIVGRISTDTTGNKWGSEFVITSNIGTQNVMSVSLIRAGGLIQCYFEVRNSSTDARIYKCTSSDEGATWSAPVSVINDGIQSTLVNASVRTVNSGRIVIPIYSTPNGSVGSPVFSVYDYYSDDNGTTWTKSGVITTSPTMYEPSIVQLSGNTLLMTLRPSAGEGFQYFSTSTDNGATWSAPTLSTLPSGGSPSKIINLSGKLVAFTNPLSTRNPLSIYKSLNNGSTWTKIADFEAGDATAYPSTSYPSLTSSPGELLVSYWETIGTSRINLKFSKILISSLSL